MRFHVGPSAPWQRQGEVQQRQRLAPSHGARSGGEIDATSIGAPIRSISGAATTPSKSASSASPNAVQDIAAERELHWQVAAG